MPKYVIEAQYLLPVYKHHVIEAPDFETACRNVIDADDWELAEQDYDNARRTTITGAVKLPPKYKMAADAVGSPAAHALYHAGLPRMEIPLEFVEPDEISPNVLFAERELATVLAALRFWQARRPQLPKADITGQPFVSERDAAILDIADNGGTVEPLLADEIDALCERLNLSPKAEG